MILFLRHHKQEGKLKSLSFIENKQVSNSNQRKENKQVSNSNQPNDLAGG